MLPRLISVRRTALSTLAAASLGLAACSGGSDQSQPEAQQTNTADTCGVAQLQEHIGQLLDVQMMQFFEAAVPSHRVLVLKPDTVATTDNVPERATIKTDADSIITSIGCG